MLGSLSLSLSHTHIFDHMTKSCYSQKLQIYIFANVIVDASVYYCHHYYFLI